MKIRHVLPLFLAAVLLTACQPLSLATPVSQSEGSTEDVQTGKAAAPAGYAHPEAIASTEWLAAHLEDDGLRIVDVRRMAANDYEKVHIPGAVYADLIQDLMTPDADVPTVIPSPDSFSSTMQRWGIDNDTTVVVYDTLGGAMGGARLWWMLHYYGHDNVKLLDGGLTKWQADGLPTEAGLVTPAAGSFVAGAPRDAWRADAGFVQQAIVDSRIMLIDALPAAMYTGEMAHSEPIRPGHIPTARNLPAPANIDPTTHALLSKDELDQRWAPLLEQDVTERVVYCEGGVFSALDFFVLYQLGQENVRLYERSLTEWGTDPQYPMEMGDGL